MMTLTRRALVFASPALLVLTAAPALAEAESRIHVVKDPGCPCCTAWMDHLRDNGFAVSFEERSLEDLTAFKREQGISEDLASCHTATIDGYIVEGHVPASDIHRLLEERPTAIGLTVPGMPYGSPGMGPVDDREAYDVLLIAADGSTRVFSSYPAA